MFELDWQIKENSGQELKFLLEGRTNVRQNEEIEAFLTKFNQCSGCSFNIESGKPDRAGKGKRIIVSWKRKCCLKIITNEQRKELQHGKNTVTLSGQYSVQIGKIRCRSFSEIERPSEFLPLVWDRFWA